MLKYWYNKTFKDYARRKGIKILWDDYRFIENTIKNLPETDQRELLRGYLTEWVLGWRPEINGPVNQNLGRYRANVYLRRSVEKRLI